MAAQGTAAFRRGKARLIAVCVLCNVLEAGILLAFDPGPERSLAAQATAVPPFGVFHDLRWLSVYHSSWLAFGLEVAALLLVRSALIAVALADAWPADGPISRPPPGSLVLRSLAITVSATCLLAFPVAVLFSFAVVPVSWLFLAAVPAFFLVALITHPVAVAPGWWRNPIPLRSLAWILLTFLVASLAGVVVSNTPAAAVVPIAAAAGVFNAAAWCGLVGALLGRAPAPAAVSDACPLAPDIPCGPPRDEFRRARGLLKPARTRSYPLPVVPAAVFLLVGLTVAGTMVGFARARPHRIMFDSAATATAGVGAPLLIIAGYGSTWNGLGDHPIPGPFLEERFSYRGLAGDGRPMGYRSGDTVKTLPVLDRMVATQVNDLRAHTGRDVAIVAESEGALIAETYLAATPSAPVNRVVFASPLLVPGLASYPTGAAEGWGVASAGLMKLLAGALRSTSPIDISPASAFMRSVDAEGTVIRRLSACPLAAYHPVALVALADTVGIPPRQAVGFPVEIMPSFHGGMIADSALDARIRTILMGRAPEQKTGWDRVGNLVQAAATAWQVPTLAATLAPQPHGAAPAAGTSRAGATRVCARIDAQLRALIWGTGAVR